MSVVEPRRGIKPAFTPFEVFGTLYLLYKSVKGVGRPTLMRLLGLGEASTRTLLRRLSEAGIIMSRGYGFMVTERGRRIIEFISNHITLAEKLPRDEVCDGCSLSGIVVRPPLSSELRQRHVLDVRDAVVREGARGALVVVSEDGQLFLPLPGGGRGDVPQRLAQALSAVMNEGDVAVLSICDVPASRLCTRIAFNAVFRLLSERCGL